MSRAASTGDDAGMTLVELLVALLVSSIIAVAIGSVFGHAMSADARSRQIDLATGELQAVSTDLSGDLRDAIRWGVSANRVNAQLADGTCRSWALVDLGRRGGGGTDGKKELRTTSYSATLLPSLPALTAGWGALAWDVTSPGGTAFSTSTVGGVDRIAWDLAVPAGDGSAPIAHITGSALPTARLEGTTLVRCW